MRRGARPAKAKAEAKPPVARKLPKSDSARVRDLERRLAEVREQQTATSEILRVISGSPTDLQPVFDTIVRNAVRLCAAVFGGLHQVDGGRITLVAQSGMPGDELAILQRDVFPLSLSRQSATGRAILDRAVIHIRDIREIPDYASLPLLKTMRSFRTVLSVPMMREGLPIGALALWRPEVQPFSDAEISLVQTFADQAVIAIENVRLFTALQEKNQALTTAHAQVTESLDQQTATSEILRVIASSPTDVQPVFDAIVDAGRRLIGGSSCVLRLLDGEALRLAAFTSTGAVGDEAIRSTGPISRHVPLMAQILSDRTPVFVADTESDPRFPRELALARGYRSALITPLLREGSVIGVINVGRRVPGPFPPSVIALLQTFADQAVIAIENTRLFKELEARNRDLSVALEQQTATSEILRVISQSQTDVQPVFEAIVASAVRLLGAYTGNLTRITDDQIVLAALTSTDAAGDAALRAFYPQSLQSESTTAQAIRERAPVNIADAHTDPRLPEAQHAVARTRGNRSTVVVPLMSHDEAIGSIGVTRREPGGFTDDEIALLQTFADQAVIAIENVRLFKELQASNRELTTALDTQTATSDILCVISQSHTNIQPVFDAIVGSAVRLLRARSGTLSRIVGDLIELAAHTSTDDAGDAATRAAFPQPLHFGGVHAQAIRNRAPLNVADAHTDARLPEATQEYAQVRGYRSQIAVPLLRYEEAVGAIAVTRRDPGGFTDDEIAILQTFADQAVIAIENVRLFTELQEKNRALTEAHAQVTEALEQQTATAEILRVIASSPTELQPVLDAVAANAGRVCGATDALIMRVDGHDMLRVAHFGPIPLVLPGFRRITSGTAAGRAILECRAIHLHDILDPDVALDYSEVPGAVWRTTLAVPLVREGIAIGAITIRRTEVRPFTEKQIDLLETFADQAVIAIENVRLFKELQEKNHALTQAHAQVTEALDQQTATSEILRVISSSPTDAQPVFDTIVRSAAQLCHAAVAAVFLTDGRMVSHPANYGGFPQALAATRARFPRPLDMGSTPGMAILTRSVVHIPDVEDPSVAEHVREVGTELRFRSVLTVPMLRESEAVGAITVNRREPGSFSDPEVDLLKTFADQAVIAVENVRLFKELEARTAALTRSVGQLTALGEVGRAVSSSLDLETVLTTIVSRAVDLSGLDSGVVVEYDEAAEEFVHRAATEQAGALVQARRETRIRKGEGVLGQTAVTLEPAQVADITVAGAYESRLRENLIASGIRAVLAVPMLREGRLLGSLVVSRNEPGNFTPEAIELLRTFATQSALAIQNARLFQEIESKSRQLEAASQHKSEFLANMSHELRTPLNAIIGYSEMLQEEAQDRQQDAFIPDLERINAAAKHQLELINDILDLSKVEAGKMELELTDFHLPMAIDNAMTLVRERATRRGIALQATVDARLGEVRGDERKIKQVVLNLLSNAIKFTPEGGRIEVRALPVEGGVEVSVSDTGVGIAPEDQEAVFEEFRQVGVSPGKQEGTGLGLTLCRKFVELHGGRIWVKSQVGAGSTFTFTVPARRGE